jgi:tellurite resistance protein TerC
MIWIYFILLVIILLAIDLGLLQNNKEQALGFKQALKNVTIWITLGLSFTIFIYFGYENHLLGLGTGSDLNGSKAAVQYITGFLIEQSLSIDNLFVIAMIMTYFRVPSQYQYKILFWGIIGVLVTRGLMISIGMVMIENFAWTNYLFGAILLWSAYKMAITDEEEEIDFEKNIVSRFISKFYPISNQYDGGNFFTISNGKKAITPLFLALLVIETTDVLFAFDSVPAVFSITKDAFIVFSSNVFAILGLRSLYFILASSMEKFEYLEKSLIVILAFIGIKIIIANFYHIPSAITFFIVFGSLSVGVLTSIYAIKNKK